MSIWKYAGFALASLAAACSSAQQKAERATAEAVGLMNAGALVPARQKMLFAVAQRDDIAVQWQVLGRIDLQLGRPVDALNDYNRVLELDATNFEALQIVSEMSFQTGQLEEAGTAADRMLALDPSSTRAMLVKGLIALDKKKLPDAVKYADQLLAISPNDEFGNVLKARVLASGHDYSAARALIEANIPPAVRTEATLSTILEIERAQGDPARFTAAYAMLIEKRPKDVTLRIEFAQFLYKIGNIEKARALLFALITENPNSVDVMRTVRSSWLDNDAAAVSAPQLAILAKTGSLTVRMGVARYLLARSRPDPAVALLATVADSGSADARALYATALFETGKVSQAISIITEILETDRANNDALLLRSRIAFAAGNLGAALGDVQIVVSDDPQNLEALRLIADVFLKRNEPQRAMQGYERAINNSPQSISLINNYGALLRQINNKQRGISVAREFTLRSPGSLAGWDLYRTQCVTFGDGACAAAAARGRVAALRNFKVYQRPGSVLGRGLFGAIS